MVLVIVVAYCLVGMRGTGVAAEPVYDSSLRAQVRDRTLGLGRSFDGAAEPVMLV
ncbi:MAG: hypothetical protein R3F14_08615 [Polyangiaceae bacterium]